MFKKVVKLTVNHRVVGNDSEQGQFRNLLPRLRKGESTVDDWKVLSRQPCICVSNLSDFDDTVRLYHGKEEVATTTVKNLPCFNSQLPIYMLVIPRYQLKNVAVAKCLDYSPRFC